MKVSINTIKFMNQRYGCAGDPAPDGPEALAQRIGAQLGAIEETIDLGKRYEGVLIVRVVTCEPHPNADRLHVCKVDDGGKASGVERDENEYVQVVCGAPNVRAGMLAAWLPPGSTVPSTYDKDPFVLEAREIRGQKSNGMMASPRELGIGDSHEGILEVDREVPPGSSFAETYELANDVVFDIENKMFTHRPDCFGFLGIARELAGIQAQSFKSPAWYRPDAELPAAEGEALPLEVRNEVPDLVPRFCAIVLRDIQLGSSPVWLQVELAKVGLRPINNIVDYTNFFMLETGQPLHAYDYDKVKALSGGDGAVLVARHPKPGEKLTLLNGKTIEPRREGIMIATDKQLIGVGGVMGGGDTEVDDQTRHIILECANFDMYSVRRTSMAHGLFTDAVTRFTKGQSPLQNQAVLAKIVDEIRRFAGGKVASDFIDDNHLPVEMVGRGSVHPPVKVGVEFINARLGLSLSVEEMQRLLENVEFQVDIQGDTLTAAAPFWRTDIELREDLVEEVGRLYGYDRLPLELPKRDLTPAPKDTSLELRARLRAVLSQSGANEVLTYSFVHGNLLDKAGQDRSQAFQIGNALSPDLQYYRLSLTPSLLDKVHPNIKAGYDEFALFELGKAHIKSEADDEELPGELNRVAFVYAAADKTKSVRNEAPFYQAQKYATELLHALGIRSFTIIPFHKPFQGAIPTMLAWEAPFAEGRAAFLAADLQGHVNTIIGVVGEYKPSIRKGLKLPQYVAGFEFDMFVVQALQEAQQQASYVSLPRFPKVEQDICLKVTADLPYLTLATFVQQACEQRQPDNTRLTLEPLDIYQRADDPDHRQITFRVAIASYERTLTDGEVNKLLDAVAAAAQEKFNAERV